MREIRSYGSARGVRSNPYPYRDILQPLRSSVFEADLELDQVRTRHSDSGALWNVTLRHPEPAELMIHGLFCPNAPKTIIPASGNVREPTQGGAHALLSQVR
jgi:hypothetical protein